MTLELRTIPDQMLRYVATTCHLDQAARLSPLMLEAMGVYGGIGLAAPQVGHSVRLWVSRHPVLPQVAMNPVISERGSQWETELEGCLSVPDEVISVDRPVTCTLTFTGLDGEQRTWRLWGFAARVAQHETDHLDGIVIGQALT